MSFFDTVETSVANLEFLNAVKHKGDVQLDFLPYEQLLVRCCRPVCPVRSP